MSNLQHVINDFIFTLRFSMVLITMEQFICREIIVFSFLGPCQRMKSRERRFQQGTFLWELKRIFFFSFTQVKQSLYFSSSTKKRSTQPLPKTVLSYTHNPFLSYSWLGRRGTAPRQLPWNLKTDFALPDSIGTQAILKCTLKNWKLHAEKHVGNPAKKLF